MGVGLRTINKDSAAALFPSHPAVCAEEITPTMEILRTERRAWPAMTTNRNHLCMTDNMGLALDEEHRYRFLRANHKQAPPFRTSDLDMMYANCGFLLCCV